MNHTGQVMKGSIGVTAPHALNKSGHNIIMIITVLIIYGYMVPCNFFDFFHCQSPLHGKKGGGLFQKVQCHADIAGGIRRNHGKHIIGSPVAIITKALYLVCQSAAQNLDFRFSGSAFK